MPDKYAYVDPVSGNDGTGVVSTTPAVAAALPFLTLDAAEVAGRQNLTTMGGDFHFRLLGGNQNTTRSFDMSSTTWPGSTSTNRLIFEGIGTGLHDGTFATTNGFSLTYTPSGGFAFVPADVHMVLRDFRLRRTDSGDLYENADSSITTLLDRMILDAIDGACVRPSAASGGGHDFHIQNCAMYARAERCIRVGFTNAAVYVENCTLLNNHATLGALDAGLDTVIARWNYAANMGAGPAYGGANWAGSTRNKNASHDTTGDTSYQSITAATGSGTQFTSLTANAENFDIKTGSALKNIATDSTLTIDILSRPRSTPDIGAFEFQVVGMVTPNTGSLALTGNAPVVTQGTVRVPVAGALALTAIAAVVSQSAIRVPTAGALALTGVAPVVTQQFVRTPVAGALSLTGIQPSVSIGGSVTRTPLTGSLTLVGYDTTHTLSIPPPTAADLVLSGAAPVVSQGVVRVPVTGSLSFVGIAPVVTQQINRIPLTGSMTLTGIAPQVLGVGSIVPSTGSLAFTGFAPVISQTFATLITPSTGSLSLVGNQVSLAYSSPVITPGTGTLSFNGAAPQVLGAGGVLPGVGSRGVSSSGISQLGISRGGIGL